MGNRPKLTDRQVANLKPANSGTRYKVADAVVPSLVVRVTDKGAKTFVLWRRWNGAANPSARALGTYPAMGLADARAKAREWLADLERGVDPREALSVIEARRTNTFGAVAEDFITRHLTKKRKGERSAHQIRKELVPVWGRRPIAEITRKDVMRLVTAIADRSGGTGAYARNIYGHIQSLFSWAIHRGHYDLEHSPCDRLRPSQLIGPKIARERVLSNDELRAVWRATEQLRYPYGPLIQMIMLTGARLNEVAAARWREFDLVQKIWTIPAERFKSNAEHRVPLTDDMLALLRGLPRWTGGDFLFTATDGQKCVNGFTVAKRQLNTLVNEELGETPAHWVLHDLRRTVRTRLAELRTPEAVAEMVIGHSPRGLARVYNLHQFMPEMRDALGAWNVRLQSIVDLPRGNIMPLRRANL